MIVGRMRGVAHQATVDPWDPLDDRLRDKIALITGGSRGIGLAATAQVNLVIFTSWSVVARLAGVSAPKRSTRAAKPLAWRPGQVRIDHPAVLPAVARQASAPRRKQSAEQSPRGVRQVDPGHPDDGHVACLEALPPYVVAGLAT